MHHHFIFKVISLITSIGLTYGCVNNYKYQYTNNWQGNNGWFINAHIQPDFNYQLQEGWELRMEFKEPLIEDMQTWVTSGSQGTMGKQRIVLKAGSWNKILNPASFSMSYIVGFKNRQYQNHLKCVEFCGKRVGDGVDICNHKTTKAPPIKTKSPNQKTTTKPSKSCTPKYNYDEVLQKSLLFYEAQRSGPLPNDQRVKWRHDSTLTDGADIGLDLTGGYFDAGDYVKFGFPMASTITNLAWGMLEFKKGYKSSGQYSNGLKAIRWGSDYFIKCHPSPDRFIGQIGNGDLDHKYWGRPEDMRIQRPSYEINKKKPGSELAAETASALVATSMVFREYGDSGYADVCLSHAKALYDFAMKYRGNYHMSIPDAAKFYKSFSGYNDELALASLWLYRATGQAKYKKSFLTEFEKEMISQNPGEYSWDNKWYAAQILAQQLKITNKNYITNFQSILRQPQKTPKGLFFVQKWGALRHAANLAFLSLVASKVEPIEKPFYVDFARTQIHYMMGDTDRSYIVGFGKNPPQRPHHASSSCPTISPCNWTQFNSPRPNPQILYGALVGGPGADDRYVDNRGDYVKNEVTCDYNAGFQSAIAGLIELAQKGQC